MNAVKTPMDIINKKRLPTILEQPFFIFERMNDFIL